MSEHLIQIAISLIAFAVIALAIHDRYLCVYCSETRLFADRWLIYVAAIALIILGSLALHKRNNN